MENQKLNNNNYEMALELWHAIQDYHLVAMGAFSGEDAVTYTGKIKAAKRHIDELLHRLAYDVQKKEVNYHKGYTMPPPIFDPVFGNSLPPELIAWDTLKMWQQE